MQKFNWDNTFNQMKSSFVKLFKKEIKRFSVVAGSLSIKDSDIKNEVKNICNYYIARDRTDLAIKTIYGYLVLNPNDDEFINLIATCLYRAKEYRIALLFINKAVSLSSSDETVKRNMEIIKSAFEKNKKFNIRHKIASDYTYLERFLIQIENKKATVAVCMIVKNEEKNLPVCLSSLKKIADEIIIIDTGSTDHTVEVAKTFGATVKSMTWDGNFSGARNLSIKDVKSDWILYLDADEYLDNSAKIFLQNLAVISKPKAYYVKIKSLLSVNNENIYTEHYMVRLFNNRSGFKFKDFIHEQLILEDEAEYERDVCPIVLWHTGYTEKAVNDRKKNERNYNLLLKAIEANPDNPFNYYNMGVNLFSTQDHRNAIKYFDLTIKKLAGKQVAYLPFCYSFKSSCYASLGEYKQAAREAKEALKIIPNFKEAYFNLANAYYYLNKFEKAIENFKNALEAKEEILLGGVLDSGVSSWKTYNGLGITYLKKADYDSAIYYLEEAYVFEKKSPMIIINLAVAYKMKGEINKIEEMLASDREILFGIVQAQQLVNILLLFNRYDSAVRVLMETLNCYKKYNISTDSSGLSPVLLKNNIAEIFYAKGDHKEACKWYAEFFKEIKTFGPSHKEALKKYSMSVFLNDRFDIAEDYIDKALKIDSDDTDNDWEIYQNAGFIKAKVSKAEKSAAYFKKAINLNNKCTQSYLGLAEILINSGQLREANILLESEPGYMGGKPLPELLFLNSEALFKLGNFQEAARNLLAHLSFKENDSVYNRLGICYMNMKNYNDAAYCFSKAADLNNRNPSYFANLGNCFAEVKNFEDAKLAYDCALLLDPGYPPAIFIGNS
ncbi:MAG: tetratricopeptide repeat protein [Actinobacteria bacterium]|nr:tetratricopeptide repeat protein [Actinomycetota bacterium]